MPRQVKLSRVMSTEPFAVTDALAVGVTEGRLRGRDLARPFQGVRVAKQLRPSGLEYPRDRMTRAAREYAPRLLQGEFFAELTAIAIQGGRIPFPHLRETTIHVGMLFPLTAPRANGTRGHQYHDGQVLMVDGLPTLDAVSAWTGCASRMSLPSLVCIGDGLMRREDPLADEITMHDAVVGHAGKRGVRKLRIALELMRPRTDSATETVVRLALVAARLPEPAVNHFVLDANGVQVAMVDLAYPEFHIAIEYEGGQHFDDPDQFLRDVDRLDGVMALDWRVIRVHKSHLGRPQETYIPRIRDALRSRGWRG